MKQEEEKTPTGQPIYRYGEASNAFNQVSGNQENIDRITKHIETHIGPIEGAFHEIISDQVHLDIHWVKPSEKYNFHFLVTSGMSDQPMNVPQGVEPWRFAELSIMLPPDWPIPEVMNHDAMQKAFSDENVYWPIRWLKLIARIPHLYNSWIGWGHSIPNGEEAEPFADNTGLGCMLVLAPMGLPDAFATLEKDENNTIYFYSLLPVYKSEMDFKLNHGVEALLALFEKNETSEVLDLGRENVCG